MSLVSCKDLSLGYSKDSIVRDLSFEVNCGDHLCIVGENGSGKSTLIKTLAGLIKPLSGELVFGEGLCAREVGYLPQQTETQSDFPASVYEIVISGRIGGRGMKPFYSHADRAVARKNMERLGILDMEKRCFRELSGGQKQRVLLARALCASSRLLLLDEPVSGLDTAITRELYSLIDALREEGVTIISVSHDLSLALDHATHILHVSSTPRFFGTRDEYLESEIYRTFAKRGGIR